MAFFEDLTAHLSTAGQEAYKAAKDLAGTGKLGLKLADESGRLDEMYEMLGRAYYDAKENGREEDLTQALEEIREKEALLASLRTEIAHRRNKKICPNCQSHTNEKNQFCPTCGTKLD